MPQLCEDDCTGLSKVVLATLSVPRLLHCSGWGVKAGKHVGADVHLREDCLSCRAVWPEARGCGHAGNCNAC